MEDSVYKIFNYSLEIFRFFFHLEDVACTCTIYLILMNYELLISNKNFDSYKETKRFLPQIVNFLLKHG